MPDASEGVLLHTDTGWGERRLVAGVVNRYSVERVVLCRKCIGEEMGVTRWRSRTQRVAVAGPSSLETIRLHTAAGQGGMCETYWSVRPYLGYMKQKEAVS